MRTDKKAQTRVAFMTLLRALLIAALGAGIFSAPALAERPRDRNPQAQQAPQFAPNPNVMAMQQQAYAPPAPQQYAQQHFASDDSLSPAGIPGVGERPPWLMPVIVGGAALLVGSVLAFFLTR